MLHKGPSSKQCSNFRQSIFLPSLASFQSVQVRRPKVHVYSEGSGAVVTNFISLQVSRLSTKTCRIIIKKHNAIINQRIHRRVGESGRVSYYFWLSVKCTFCGSTKFSSSELRDHASSSGSKSIFCLCAGYGLSWVAWLSLISIRSVVSFSSLPREPSLSSPEPSSSIVSKFSFYVWNLRSTGRDGCISSSVDDLLLSTGNGWYPHHSLPSNGCSSMSESKLL